MTYRIINARPITPEGILTADLIVSDGVIERLLDPSAAWEDVPTVDAEGCYVSPGFVDIHQHGGGGADYMDATPDTYTRATEAHVRHGTTSVLPTLLSADTDALLRAIDCYKAAVTDPAVRVHLLGLHLEGPYISPAQAGAQKPEHIRPFIKDEYERILAAAEGHVRRFSVAPEVEGGEEFAARAAEDAKAAVSPLPSVSNGGGGVRFVLLHGQDQNGALRSGHPPQGIKVAKNGVGRNARGGKLRGASVGGDHQIALSGSGHQLRLPRALDKADPLFGLGSCSSVRHIRPPPDRRPPAGTPAAPHRKRRRKTLLAPDPLSARR